MAATFSGAGEAAKAAGEADLEKLHAKIGQLVVAAGLALHLLRRRRHRRVAEAARSR